MDVHVRGIDPEVWRALRVEAVQRRISVAKLLHDAWRAYLTEKAKDARSA